MRISKREVKVIERRIEEMNVRFCDERGLNRSDYTDEEMWNLIEESHSVEKEAMRDKVRAAVAEAIVQRDIETLHRKH